MIDSKGGRAPGSGLLPPFGFPVAGLRRLALKAVITRDGVAVKRAVKLADSGAA